MVVDTVSLLSPIVAIVDPRTYGSPSDVLSLSYCFKMLRIYTIPVLTTIFLNVVYCEALWDLSNA